MPKLTLVSRTGFALVTALTLAAPAYAQDASKNYILQGRADQQDVRTHTTALAEQIQGLIDELAQNGITGDDLKVLNTTKAVLNNLSAQEMQRVLSSLQKAGDNPGTQTGEQNLVDAYGTQKGIILQFRQVLKEYEQRQAADELPAKFKELTDRQTQVMWTTAQVAASIAGRSQNELNTMQQTTAQIVQSDQNALANDVASAKQMLDRAAPDATGDQGRAMQQAQQDLKSGQLQAALDKANADLAAGHLLQATTDQQAARDLLRQLAKDLNPPTTTADALNDFAATLNQIIEEQKDLLNQTRAAESITPRVTGLDAKQGMIVDKTNSLQEDMQSLSPAVAGLVKDAMLPMQIARAVLRPLGGHFDKAETSQQEAIAKLEDAAKQLNQQLADTEKAAADAAKDSTQKLQDLQNQIQQAMQQQQQTTQQTAQAENAPQPDQNALNQAQQNQQKLQQEAQAMQQTAAPLSLPAAQALANAQQAMNQAQQAMTDPSQAQQAQQAQQQAQQDLQQANQAVGQQIAQSQQQTADPAQLQQASNNLQQAQNDVGNAMADAQQQQQQAAGQQPQPNTPPTMQQADQALQQAAQATQAAAATPGLPDAAQNAVADAQKAIAQGQKDASQGNAPATAADAANAQASLAQAQAAVAVAQAGMTPGPAMPGGPPQPGPPMPNGPPGTDAAKQIGQGANDKGPLHGVAGSPGKFLTVMSREREAISETEAENRPQEYSPMIDQYLKNLSDQATTSSSQ